MMEYLILLNTCGVLLLSLWAVQHIRKSRSTWKRFDHIHKRFNIHEDVIKGLSDRLDTFYKAP